MLTSPYSRPEFDPYGSNDVPDDYSGHWKAPLASQPVTGELQIPGSKSLTNRELVLAALADGPSTIKLPLHSRDSRLMIDALKSLGADITEVPGDGAFGPDWHITPSELVGSTTIDCGLAGTLMRFLPPVASLAL